MSCLPRVAQPNTFKLCSMKLPPHIVIPDSGGPGGWLHCDVGLSAAVALLATSAGAGGPYYEAAELVWLEDAPSWN